MTGQQSKAWEQSW